MGKRTTLTKRERARLLAKALGGARKILPSDVDLCRALLMFTSYHQKVECLNALEALESGARASGEGGKP